MKILLTTCMAIPHTGGASTHFKLLADSLQAGNMLGGCVPGQKGAPSKFEKVVCAINALGRKELRRVALLRKTAQLMTRAIDQSLSQSHIDLIHSHDPLATWAALRSSSVQNHPVPIVQTVHGPWSREAMSVQGGRDSLFIREIKRIEREASAGSSAFIAVDKGQAAILGDDLGVADERVAVIHNAVDCASIRSIAEQKYESGFPAPYFVVPRRLVPKNGVEVAIHACRQVPDPRCQILVAGDGPCGPELRSLVERAGLSSRVHFLGSLSREVLLPLIFKSSGVIVPSVPSAGVVEATSLAVIESFVCGVPVIASDLGGLAELIQSEITGFLFPPGDAVALGSRLNDVLMMNPDQRGRICDAAWNSAKERWDVSPWLAQIQAVYQRVLSGHEKSRPQ